MSRGHDNRGRHRRASSPETRRFHELERDPGSVLNVKPPPAPKPQPPAPPPARPSWLGEAQYAALLELRSDLKGRA